MLPTLMSFSGLATGRPSVGSSTQFTEWIGQELNRKAELAVGPMLATPAAAVPATPLMVPTRLVLPEVPARLISRLRTKMLPVAWPVPMSRINQVELPVRPPVDEKVILPLPRASMRRMFGLLGVP